MVISSAVWLKDFVKAVETSLSQASCGRVEMKVPEAKTGDLSEMLGVKWGGWL